MQENGILYKLGGFALGRLGRQTWTLLTGWTGKLGHFGQVEQANLDTFDRLNRQTWTLLTGWTGKFGHFGQAPSSPLLAPFVQPKNFF